MFESAGTVAHENQELVLKDYPTLRHVIGYVTEQSGGEAANVLVVPDLSYAAHKEYLYNPATDHRVYYVAVTRTKKALHIMLPKTNRSYDL